MTKRTDRKLQDTSWLAQVIKDKMDAEFDRNRNSARYDCLSTLHAIVNEADDPENHSIYYDNCEGKRQIIICDIPSLAAKHGSDFGREGMRSKLLGLQARYTDDEGQYLVSVLVTHDLNSATIKDISELLFAMAA
jgi:hypothetical protein